MAETLPAPAFPVARATRTVSSAGLPRAPSATLRRRWKARLDRLAVAIIVAAPPAALIAAWMGWMPPR